MVSIFSGVLAIWTSSFEKVLFSSVAHFFIGSLIFGEFHFLSSPVYFDYQSFV
jgi:type IV secretory pathway TrbL component